MAVAQTATRIAKTAGNGSTTAFNFSFKIFQATDLTCYKVAADGTYTLGVLNGGGATGFTVSFDTDAETGTVTWNTAPVSGGFSVIIGDALPLTQPASFPREGVTPASTLKNAYDKLTIQIQQIENRLDRTLSQPKTPVNPEPIDVDPPEDRRAAIFTDNGDGTWTIVPSEYDPDELFNVASTFAPAYLEGLYADKPANPTVKTTYYATDNDSLEIYIPTSGHWRLIG